MTGAERRPLPAPSAFLDDVLRGLASSPRSIPFKWFYDRAGSELFDRITETEDYYPTAAETELLREHARAIALALGPQVDLVELGSGSSIKTRILLDALTPRAPLARYVPVDISEDHLRESARALQRRHPELLIEPLVADYSGPFDGPRPITAARRAVFFPGSSIGNFEPREAIALLRRCRELAGERGVVIVGVDLPKDRATIERAYDDREGVTRRFHLNLLVRMQRELGARVELDAFAHSAPWQAKESRVEMRLVATRRTSIEVAGRRFELEAGEPIVTEHCYKYDVPSFAALAREAGLTSSRVWLDPQRRVSMHWLEP